MLYFSFSGLSSLYFSAIPLYTNSALDRSLIFTAYSSWEDVTILAELDLLAISGIIMVAMIIIMAKPAIIGIIRFFFSIEFLHRLNMYDKIL